MLPNTVGKTQQTDMDDTMKCSSLTPSRVDDLKSRFQKICRLVSMIFRRKTRKETALKYCEMSAVSMLHGSTQAVKINGLE
jgi:hypothetical protein